MSDGSTARTNAAVHRELRLDDDAGVWRLSWRVIQHEPRTFWIGTALFAVFFTLPVAIGLILAQAFDAVANEDLETALWWSGALVITQVVRMASIHAGALVWTRVWLQMQTFLRANLLAAQVASGGPEAGQPIGSAGEAVTHFRDDAEDVARFVDGLVDVTAGIVFTVAAGVVLGATDLGAALVLVVPLVIVGAAIRSLDTKVKAYRRDDREATAAVTGLVGDTMAASTTVKVNGAVDDVIARLRTLVARRRTTAVRDRTLEESIGAFSDGSADVGLGLVLLVGAGALASGRFGVGELALFTAYLGWLNFLPKMVGRVLARRKQAGLAFDRMRGLVAAQDARNTVLPKTLPIEPSTSRPRPIDRRPERTPLERLDVDGITARFESGGGVSDVSFSIERGQFVVVTGPVGSGKTTLLRAVLGLTWQTEASGSVRWNGVEVDDRAAFFVPPNAAFLPQVPQLVSDSLAENIAFGEIDLAELERALSLAVLSEDVASMADGSGTMVGPRGLRLSGGQRQRLAGARALVRRPELVVLDDLSSALDVETERRIWENLRAAGSTVLAVSHRAVAFEGADRVLRLDAGRLSEIARSAR